MFNEIGPHYGYFLNGAKTHVLVKKEYVDTANEIYQDTAMTISVDGDTSEEQWVQSPSYRSMYREKKGW